MELSEAKSPSSIEILVRGNSRIVMFLGVTDLHAPFING